MHVYTQSFARVLLIIVLAQTDSPALVVSLLVSLLSACAQLLLTSMIGAGVSLLGLSFSELMDYTTLSVVMVMMFVVFFELGLGPIPWLITAEIFPMRSRATAVAMATAVNWFCNLITRVLLHS